MTKIRKGQSPAQLTRAEFGERFRVRFYDPAFNIGYFEPYFNSHDALDKDQAVQDEVRNVARSLVHAVKELRAGRSSQPDKGVKPPRRK